MEDCTIHNESNKRSRDELDRYPYSPEPKRSRVDSVVEYSDLNRVDLFTESSEFFRADSVSISIELKRVDSVIDLSDQDAPDVLDINSPDSIQMTDDILDILEETDIDSSIQGLDSVFKSFDEELGNPFPATDSGELDYLLGASDDELGLPPAKSPHLENPENKSTESVTSPYQVVDLKEDFAFVDELPIYDSFDYGFGEDNYDKSDFVILGGLFDYSETPENSWQPESLKAL